MRREDVLPALLADGPFAFMRRLSEEMDQLIGAVFSGFGTGKGGLRPNGEHGLGVSSAQWVPPIEIVERDHQLVIRADLPGLSKDDVKVEVMDDMLTIAGERREEHEETREGYRHSERHYGRFFRSIPLPEGVNAEDVRATFHNGVLEITMPAPQHEQKGRRIEVQEGASGGAQPSGEQAKTAA
jgi:HSP20 family protein